jgi:hypothetical protein
MSYDYRGCRLVSGGRIKPIARLQVPSQLIRGLNKGSDVVAREILDLLFRDSFGRPAPSITRVDGGVGDLYKDKFVQVELPEIEDGEGRLRKFVDCLHEAQTP